MNYSGTEMNITACVVPAEVAVTPKGVVEQQHRSLGWLQDSAKALRHDLEMVDHLVQAAPLGQSTKE